MNFKNGYELQDYIVIKELMQTDNYTLEQATEVWYTSEIRKQIQDILHYDWASPQRCYWELTLELANDERWFTHPLICSRYIIN